MAEQVSPFAGKPAPPAMLVNVARLVTSYFALHPDPTDPRQRVAFGTSGHRGSAFTASFNEAHILAITEAVSQVRKKAGVDGPLFVGMDTHALSEPAFATALEVLAANGVTAMVDAGGGYTPTPVISHAILTYNRGRTSGLADGIVITPSHNPPEDGGFKYNPPNGGPADVDVTREIEAQANALIAGGLGGVARVDLARARGSGLVRPHDYVTPYVDDLGAVVDLEKIRAAGVRVGVDPLGGAAVAYWPRIAERWGIDLRVVNDAVDPTFRFMTVDHDGKIRMDCSSPYAMARLVGLARDFDVAFANDTDADRHGIVTPTAGLMRPNDYLASAIAYLFAHRPDWGERAMVGKTVVSSGMIDRIAAQLGRRLYETPVGFKWFTAGLLDGGMGFAGEESAGACYLRRDGRVWTTDKDGPILGLLAAEITAVTGEDPARFYARATDGLGAAFYERIDAPATAAQKARLAALDPATLALKTLAGEAIETVLSKAPGDGEPIGGVKALAQSGWFAARPSGTEEVYKIYAESFRSVEHLKAIQAEAQAAVDKALAGT
jgi:phosphoglucomutase